ncbi:MULTISPECIES: hypothetical protein [Aquimarina]|uniref:Uncharacterized protein n=1 Tax=Aquimarina algiphila TaxID=2047982 RepID=A0A554VPL4_9FLAO|nr:MULTISPECIES: hypothetical protein [Aquimarina]TSE10410.1 hypothetical protein FOF46_05075 [Aquimarina algiphila]
MKKIVEISSGNTALKLVQKGNKKITFIKVYDSNQKLIRQSHSSVKKYQFSASPGKYIVETDGDLELIEQTLKDAQQESRRVYRNADINFRNNVLTLKEIPFRQVDDLVGFIENTFENKKEILQYLERYSEKLFLKTRKKMFSDSKTIQALTGMATQAEEARVKKQLKEFIKSEEEVSKGLKKAKNTKEMLAIVSQFSESDFKEEKKVQVRRQKTTRRRAGNDKN